MIAEFGRLWERYIQATENMCVPGAYRIETGWSPEMHKLLSPAFLVPDSSRIGKCTDWGEVGAPVDAFGLTCEDWSGSLREFLRRRPIKNLTVPLL